MTEENTVEVKVKIPRTRRLKVSYNISQTDGSHIASIKVSGLYLHKVGFHPDGYFDMTINEDGSLTIRPVSKEQNEEDKRAKRAVWNNG